jgi:type III pantothenate kinase
MTPDVVVDIGNTRIKWGRCSATRVEGMIALPPGNTAEWHRQAAAWELGLSTRWVVTGVNPPEQERFTEWATSAGGEVLNLTDYRQIPLRVEVDEPERVGLDRLLTALAAHARAKPRAAVAVNLGTAVTIDVVDGVGVFRGGVIFPGPRLMALALHQHTAKLPLVDMTDPRDGFYPSVNTTDAIRSGIRAAVQGAVRDVVQAYATLFPVRPKVFVTGGAVGRLGDPDDAPPGWPRMKHVPTLTLDGIRIAAEALP